VQRGEPGFSSLTLIEPVTIGLLREVGEDRALADIGSMIEHVLQCFDHGDALAALERFTDYWTGAGAWARIPAAQRLTIFARADKLRSDLRTLWDDRTPAAFYRAMRIPVFVIGAEHTSLAGRRMAQLIAAAIPGSHHSIVVGADHMAPITHAHAVALMLRSFWRGCAPERHRTQEQVC
jgi:pimeloyl-ACP methyl ester carboxylesterase